MLFSAQFFVHKEQETVCNKNYFPLATALCVMLIRNALTLHTLLDNF
jgi:hypothetical protein